MIKKRIKYLKLNKALKKLSSKIAQLIPISLKAYYKLLLLHQMIPFHLTRNWFSSVAFV